ncbi:hypothetical protein POM88_047964 [Heracleum sosnowskyi]|uniref:Uncharacterized protein n=1 Tax=Heracleum sosnowskyi TaxID=360622 RepID=A0AAD8M052_9APIA|nr:hypothetical protein POM88_047964 [Heracleum sosnowskyi]
MRKLASPVNIMNDPKSLEPASLDAEGVADKGAGFALFESPKKRNGGASFGSDGFAEIANKKKRSQGANVGKVNDFAPNSQVRSNEGFGSTKTIKETSFPNQIMNDPKSLEPARLFTVGVAFKGASCAQFASPKKRNGGASLGNDGLAEAKMRRFRNHAENHQTKSRRSVQAQSGKTVAQLKTVAQSGKTLAQLKTVAQSGQQVPTQSGQSGQRVPAQSGECVPAQSGQRFLVQYAQRVPDQHALHSPAQSRQYTSQYGQNSPNQSRQLTAQSRQHTPESHSQQRATAAQSEPIGHTPPQSHPSTLNVSSTAANDNICWNLGSIHSDGREVVEGIKKILEPSNKVSAKNREIMFEQLEPTGYNWKSVSKSTQDFYWEEFKKYYVWRQSDAIVYKGWLDYARRNWVEFWKTTAFNQKSAIQKSNRRSGVGGQPSSHTSGSASHRTVAARMKIQYKCEPTADQLFKLTHTRRVKKKKNLIGVDGEDCEDVEEVETTWIDKKSQQIYETFLALCEQHKEAGLPVDKNALFLEATRGPDKKKRVQKIEKA